MLGAGFKNQENILNYIPGLNRARENPLVIFLEVLTKAVQIDLRDTDGR